MTEKIKIIFEKRGNEEAPNIIYIVLDNWKDKSSFTLWEGNTGHSYTSLTEVFDIIETKYPLYQMKAIETTVVKNFIKK